MMPKSYCYHHFKCRDVNPPRPDPIFQEWKKYSVICNGLWLECTSKSPYDQDDG